MRTSELRGKFLRTGGEPERLVWEKTHDGREGRDRSCGAVIMILNFILKARNLIINFKTWPFLLPSKEGDRGI